MNFEQMQKYVTPRNYTIVMLLAFGLSLWNSFYSKSNFAFLSAGWILGLWTGSIMWWIFVRRVYQK